MTFSFMGNYHHQLYLLGFFLVHHVSCLGLKQHRDAITVYFQSTVRYVGATDLTKSG